MKKLVITLSVLFLIVAKAQEQKISNHFEKQQALSKVKENQRKKIDTLNFSKDLGFLEQFSKKNILYCQDIDRAIPNPHDVSNASYKLLKWNRSECYDLSGILVKKVVRFGLDKENVQESYYKSSNTFIKGSSIGDILFTSSAEDILKILEENGINPKELLTPISMKKFMFRKLITPSGEFWEFIENSRSLFAVAILINDKTKQVVAKSFDTSPNYTSKILQDQYQNKKRQLYYPKDFKFKMTESEVYQLGVSLAGEDYGIHVVPISKQLWMLDYYKKSPEGRKVLLIIEDKSGKTLINSEDYSKDYLGEEDLKKQINNLLIKKE